MDNCIVCLESDIDTFARVNVKSSEWIENNIQQVIEKHLWWWYIKQSPPHTFTWICRQCWQELSSFHNFYLKVEKVHKQYLLRNSSFIKSLKANEELFDIKEEFKALESATGDHTSLEISKKTNETFENVQINEIPIAEIKYESDEFPDADCGLSDILESNMYPENDQSTPDDANDKASCKEEICTKIKRRSKIKKILKSKKTIKDINKNKKIPTNSNNNNTPTKTEISKRNDAFLAQSDFDILCHICNSTLTDFNNLKSHYRKVHSIRGYATCCNKKFYKRGLLVDHLRVHQNPNCFKCTHCDKTLSNSTNFENHLQYHKQTNEKLERIFNCDKCEKSFFKKCVFDRHILSHVPEEERKFQCDVCDKKFATEYLVRQHKTYTHLNKYVKMCDICGKSFRERFSFQRHMDEHNGALPPKFPCDICGAELTNKYQLNRHKKKMHTEQSQQKRTCPFCSKVSPNMQAHRSHVSYAHTLERKHACHMCDKKFRRPLDLKEHLSTHTGEPLYNCSYCPKTFISSGNMSKHIKLFHRREWEEAKLKKLQVQQKLVADSVIL